MTKIIPRPTATAHGWMARSGALGAGLGGAGGGGAEPVVGELKGAVGFSADSPDSVMARDPPGKGVNVARHYPAPPPHMPPMPIAWDEGSLRASPPGLRPPGGALLPPWGGRHRPQAPFPVGHRRSLQQR